MMLGKKLYENLVRKGEHAGNQHFLLIPHCFLPLKSNIILATMKLSSASAFNFDKAKILLFGNGLKNNADLSMIGLLISFKYKCDILYLSFYTCKETNWTQI